MNALSCSKLPQLGATEVHLYWGRVEPALEIAAGTLSKSELERAAVFRFERDRRAFLARRHMLRQVLGRHAGLEPAELSFQLGAHKKPFLEDDPSLCFNSSNSADRFLIVLARERAVGVDLQEHKLGERPVVLAKGVFTPAEIMQLKSAKAEDHEALFFRGWSRKEAALKALGTGFMQEARELHVGLEASASEQPWIVPTEPKLADWPLLDLPAPAEFSAAVCAQGLGWSVRAFELCD